jgi:hypothetical protein
MELNFNEIVKFYNTEFLTDDYADFLKVRYEGEWNGLNVEAVVDIYVLPNNLDFVVFTN